GLVYDFRVTLGTATDVDLTLYASNGTTLLDIVDDSNGTLAPEINWLATFTGLAYLKVTGGLASATGTYTLVVSSASNTTPTKLAITQIIPASPLPADTFNVT